MKKRMALIIVTIILFLLLFGFGLFLAQYKPLWNDELYTHFHVIVGKTYLQIILGRTIEGSVCPLNSLIQKILCDVANHSLPEALNAKWHGVDTDNIIPISSRVFLRINPVFFMSLAVVLIFYYFSRFYSIWTGIYSLLVSLSSFMVWYYWTDARPYAPWVFLTTIQVLLFMHLFKEGKFNRNLWTFLTIIHILLSLTVTISIVQITSAAFLLWFLFERNWHRYIPLFIIPAVICLIYYVISPKFNFYFVDGPVSLISSSISKDRFLIIFVFAFYLLVSYSQKAIHWPRLLLKNNLMNEQETKLTGSYFLLTSLMLTGYSLLLLMFKLKEDLSGFRISNRYFIPLTPIGIIAVTLFSLYLVRAPKNKIGRLVIALCLAILLIIRFERTLGIVRHCAFLNLPF